MALASNAMGSPAPTQEAMRALVTGADGFAGSHLVEHLAEEGDRVIESSADVTDRAALFAEFAQARPEAVYHLAGRADVADSWQHPLQAFRVNTEGTINTLDAARSAGAERVLVVSSASVYGQAPAGDLPVGEVQPLRPVSPYGATKAAAEMYCLQAWLGHGLQVMRARSFNHVGPGQTRHFVLSSIAAQVADCERSGGKTIRVGDLEARRDFVDVRDVVRAYRLILVGGTPGEAYNVCSGIDRSVAEMAEALLAMSSAELRLEVDPELMRPVDMSVMRGDGAKLREATGWKPEITIRQTLADMLGHWRALA